jgi:hypothetical protein
MNTPAVVIQRQRTGAAAEAAGAGGLEEISAVEVGRRLQSTLNLVRNLEILVPYDDDAVNLGLAVW